MPPNGIARPRGVRRVGGHRERLPVTFVPSEAHSTAGKQPGTAVADPTQRSNPCMIAPMHFHDVAWDDPLNVAPEIARIPKGAQIRGVFIAPLAVAARAAGITAGVLRDRYTTDQLYPLVEHATLLVEVARASYPKLALRRGLRKLGRAAIGAYLDSVLGRVTVGSTDDPRLMLETIAKSYVTNIVGARARLERVEPRSAVAVLENVPYFLDCHHVGVIEQSLRRCNVEAQIRVAELGEHSAAFECVWR